MGRRLRSAKPVSANKGVKPVFFVRLKGAKPSGFGERRRGCEEKLGENDKF
ncbi:MAG: hypothetical protein IKY61_07860 [Thermoguttaceae bacterium]|nr:hypothetical protein [Thermoguttaceae bacterium]